MTASDNKIQVGFLSGEAVELPFLYVGPTQSFCSVSGEKHFYHEWVMPEEISNALGMGCSARHHHNFSASIPPVAQCVKTDSSTVCYNVK